MLQVLLEAMTYREGHHSTSDDSTRYRAADEIKSWREVSNPVRRLRRYMERRGWWDGEKEEALVAAERKAVLTAMAAAEKKPRPDVTVSRTDRPRRDGACDACPCPGMIMMHEDAAAAHHRGVMIDSI